MDTVCEVDISSEEEPATSDLEETVPTNNISTPAVAVKYQKKQFSFRCKVINNETNEVTRTCSKYEGNIITKLYK